MEVDEKQYESLLKMRHAILYAVSRCEDCGVSLEEFIVKSDHHGGKKAVCVDRDSCNRRRPGLVQQAEAGMRERLKLWLEVGHLRRAWCRWFGHSWTHEVRGIQVIDLKICLVCGKWER